MSVLGEGDEAVGDRLHRGGTPFTSFFTPTEMLARGPLSRLSRRSPRVPLLRSAIFAGRTDGLRPPNNPEELLVAMT
jgi:hypothetical protein